MRYIRSGGCSDPVTCGRVWQSYKKHGSYVAFYEKKCYNKTGAGWLFTIMRYKDDSYMDMASYE